MKRSAALSAIVVALFAAIVAAALMLSPSRPEPAKAVEPGDTSSGTQPVVQVVRPDSHRLGEPGTGKVVLVEFLDFECEACRAAYPIVEDMRKKYAGKVDFVMRYFPIPSHPNAQNAALAVEAAARQGRLEAMYQRMYDTQAAWGEQQQSKAALFRGFAEELGLDTAAYDKAVADPDTAERVERDRQDGLSLGVSGTPTFFLNGQMLNLTSVQDFYAQVEAAVNG